MKLILDNVGRIPSPQLEGEAGWDATKVQLKFFLLSTAGTTKRLSLNGLLVEQGLGANSGDFLIAEGTMIKIGSLSFSC